MWRFMRFFLVLALLLAVIPAAGVSAAAEDETCKAVAKSLGAKFRKGTIDGAQYCLIIPETQAWNNDVVVFAHGYVSPNQPVGIPWDQAISANLNLPAMLVNMGYAFAITSYSRNGLAVSEGVQDVVNLVDQIRKTENQLDQVFLTGVSEGGLITTLAIEQHPELFAGGLASCGPVGDFQYQINYWGDFRAVFDVLYPDLLAPFGGSAVDIPEALIAGWGALPNNPGPVALAVFAAVSNPDPLNQAKLATLITATQAPIDVTDLSTVPQTVMAVLDYNIKATNDGKAVLGGNPYFNKQGAWLRDYGSPELNALVRRYEADLTALMNVQAHLQTSGVLARPLVLMHTTLDPVVPYQHAPAYVAKATAAGSGALVDLVTVPRYGHCNFTQADALTAFGIMVTKAGLLQQAAVP